MLTLFFFYLFTFFRPYDPVALMLEMAGAIEARVAGGGVEQQRSRLLVVLAPPSQYVRASLLLHRLSGSLGGFFLPLRERFP